MARVSICAWVASARTRAWPVSASSSIDHSISFGFNKLLTSGSPLGVHRLRSPQRPTKGRSLEATSLSSLAPPCPGFPLSRRGPYLQPGSGGLPKKPEQRSPSRAAWAWPMARRGPLKMFSFASEGGLESQHSELSWRDPGGKDSRPRSSVQSRSLPKLSAGAEGVGRRASYSPRPKKYGGLPGAHYRLPPRPGRRLPPSRCCPSRPFEPSPATATRHL